MQQHSHSKLARKSGDHSVTFTLETHTREELFGLGAVLADILSPALLQNSEHPVFISVNGDYGSGKKIIPDAARARLLGSSAKLVGNLEFDERWFGQYKKQSIQLDFMNAGWSDGYSDKVLNEYYRDDLDRVIKFSEARKHPGISFIHNCGEAFKNVADITIDLKVPGLVKSWTGADDNKAIIAANKSAMKSWKRSLSLGINAPLLVTNPDFMAACQTLSDRIADLRPGKLKNIQNMVTRSAINVHRNLAIASFHLKKDILGLN